MGRFAIGLATLILVTVGRSTVALAGFTGSFTVPPTGTTVTKPSTTTGFDFIMIKFTDGSTDTVTVKVPPGTKKSSDKDDLVAAALTAKGYTATGVTGGVNLSENGPKGKTISGVSSDEQDSETDKWGLSAHRPYRSSHTSASPGR